MFKHFGSKLICVALITVILASIGAHILHSARVIMSAHTQEINRMEEILDENYSISMLNILATVFLLWNMMTGQMNKCVQLWKNA